MSLYNNQNLVMNYFCAQHGDQLIKYVCIEEHCKHPKLLCNQCILLNSAHKIHEKVPFQQFIKNWDQIYKINHKIKEIISDKLKRFHENFLTHQKYIEEIILSKFDCQNGSLLYQKLESQQLYGLIESVFKEKSMKKFLESSLSIEKFCGSLSSLGKELVDSMDKLEVELLLEMKTLTNKIKKIDQETIIKSLPVYNMKIRNFQFSLDDKSHVMKIQDGGKSLVRTNYPQKNGYSVYGTVNRPLTLENPQINFRLEHQGYRFVYFGVCLREKFRELDFEGKVYEMGGGMWAIRQNQKEGKSGVTLHDSLVQYSNKKVVGWDFKVGDLITMRLQGEEILFVKNGHEEFSMPLDRKEDGNIYPFVGMKCTGDKISIVD